MEVNTAGSWSLVVFPRARNLGQICLTALSMVWTMGSNAASVSLQVGVLMCLRVGRLCRGIWTEWIDGPRLVWGSIRQSARSEPWVTTAPCSATSLGRVYWELVRVWPTVFRNWLSHCAQHWSVHTLNPVLSFVLLTSKRPLRWWSVSTEGQRSW